MTDISGTAGCNDCPVTATALELQNRGLIRNSRGQVDVIDRNGLEQASCECYEVVVERQRLIMGQ